MSTFADNCADNSHQRAFLPPTHGLTQTQFPPDRPKPHATATSQKQTGWVQQRNTKPRVPSDAPNFLPQWHGLAQWHFPRNLATRCPTDQASRTHQSSQSQRHTKSTPACFPSPNGAQMQFPPHLRKTAWHSDINCIATDWLQQCNTKPRGHCQSSWSQGAPCIYPSMVSFPSSTDLRKCTCRRGCAKPYGAATSQT